MNVTGLRKKNTVKYFEREIEISFLLVRYKNRKK